MKYICTLLSLLLFTHSAQGWDKQNMKYAQQVLTDDYHILRETDLDSEYLSHENVPFSFVLSSRYTGGYNYWQCFPSADVKFTLTDYGYADKNISGKENLAELIITVTDKRNIVHKYFMRRVWAISVYQDRLRRWKKLMHHESYTCLSGEYGGREMITKNANHQTVYSWVFDRIKTSKGCDSYFTRGCDPLKKSKKSYVFYHS